jgi:hypothetical protein
MDTVERMTRPSNRQYSGPSRRKNRAHTQSRGQHLRFFRLGKFPLKGPKSCGLRLEECGSFEGNKSFTTEQSIIWAEPELPPQNAM